MLVRYRKPRPIVALILAASVCAFSTPSHAQWLYLSETPVDCIVDMMATIARGPYTLYMHAPDHSSANGVIFRVVIDELGAEDEVIITPAPGVTTLGDVRTMMQTTWSPRTLEHEPILTIAFVDHEPFASSSPGGWLFAGVRNAVLMLPGGVTLPLADMDAVRVHCYDGGGLSFRPPSSGDVAVGRTSLVEFSGVSSGGYWGPGATNLIAGDTAGWVVGMSSNWLWNYGCGECPWFWETLVLTVTVPESATVGASSIVTISEGGFALTQFPLTAVAPNRVETKTWGAIKALYR